VAQNGTVFVEPLKLSNINRFSKSFHCQNQEKICNNIISKDPTTLQVCLYTTLWNVSVLKATIENKTTSVTTHFKKVTTGNSVFIVSVIVWTSCGFFTSNVQCVRLAAGRRTQACDATDQWRDQWNAATVCPTQWRSPALAGWLSWIVDHLLKAIPNSVIDWIQVSVTSVRYASATPAPCSSTAHRHALLGTHWRISAAWESHVHRAWHHVAHKQRPHLNPVDYCRSVSLIASCFQLLLLRKTLTFHISKLRRSTKIVPFLGHPVDVKKRFYVFYSFHVFNFFYVFGKAPLAVAR